MPRFVVLLLPLLVLWLAFRVGGEAELSSKNEVLKSERKQVGHSSDFQGGKFSQRDSGEGLEGTKALVEKLRNEKLAGSAVGTSASENGSIVERIWAQIDPALLNGLTVADRVLLRSYISNLSSPEALDQPWLCWGEGVSMEKALAFHEAEKLTGLVRSEYALFANQFFASGGWDETATDGDTGGVQGQPMTVTWSIVPDGTSAPGTNEQANAPSNFRSWMASLYGGSATGPAAAQPWFRFFQDAFDEMEETCGITLRYESNDDGATMNRFTLGETGIRGDIRISARAIDGNSGTLAFAYAPDHGDIVFDSSDNVFENTSSSSIALYNVIGHELGHSLGLAHVCPLNETKLLEPILTRSFRGPRFDEHQSLQRLYGDRLERDAFLVNNDSTNNATLVTLVEDQSFGHTRLSIDDNTDRDYFKIQGLKRQKLTVIVRPGEGTYLEGPSTDAGCSDGVNFDSASIHDLKVEIIAPDGETVIAVSNSSGEGTLKLINQFELDSDGLYYVKVSGDTSNAAQLYSIDFRLGDRDPEAILEERESLFVAESGSVKNGRLDPNETVKLAIEIANEGVLSTGPLTTVVTASANVSIFSTVITPAINGSETGMLEVVFGAVGECGDLANLSFEISDDSGQLLSIDKEVRLGELLNVIALDQKFDASSDLPPQWTTAKTGAGVSWDAVSSRFVSALRSAFSPGVGSVSEASLVSPSFELTSGGGTLIFEHLYRNEIGFDGAVLEASRNGGAWFDLIEAPFVEVTGGYDRTIKTGYNSSIAGQSAWSAKLTEFMVTTVRVPPEWTGEALRLRWRLVHDNSGSSDGWWIDNVKFQMEIADCETHRPALNLVLTEGGLDENNPSEDAVLTLSSELPLAQSLAVTLARSGTASGEDFEGNLAVILAAGQDEVSIPLTALSDSLSEGDETLTLTIPGDQPGFVPGDRASETLTITDLMTVDQWLAGFFNTSVPLTGDSDGDGWSELAEYLLGTDPTSRTSQPALSIQPAENGYLIPLTGLPDRGDASLGLESSGNLVEWLPVPFEKSEEGLATSHQAGKNFLRLTFSLNQ